MTERTLVCNFYFTMILNSDYNKDFFSNSFNRALRDLCSDEIKPVLFPIKGPLGCPVGIQRLSTTQIVLEGLLDSCAKTSILLTRAWRVATCTLVTDDNTECKRRCHMLHFESNQQYTFLSVSPTN